MVDIYEDLKLGGFKAYQQGTAPQNLPDEFLTVFEDPSNDILHADNKAQQMLRDWTLIYYTKDTNKIFSGLIAVKNFLQTKGYKISGIGYDVGGAWEGYDARGLDVAIIENLED